MDMGGRRRFQIRAGVTWGRRYFTESLSGPDSNWGSSKGCGSFCLWDGIVYFSTSAGQDFGYQDREKREEPGGEEGEPGGEEGELVAGA